MKIAEEKQIEEQDAEEAKMSEEEKMRVTLERMQSRF